MGRHRSFSSEFKRQIAREFLDGREGLHELTPRYSQSRKLIRLWIRKYEAGEFSDEWRDRYGSPRTRRKSPNSAQGRTVDDGGPVVFEPDVEVHPIYPHVNVLAPAEVALTEAGVFFLPAGGKPGDVGRRQTGRVLAQQPFQCGAEIARRKPAQIEKITGGSEPKRSNRSLASIPPIKG